MPIFEYKCRKCGNQFEFLVIPSSPTPACPSCKGQDLQELLSLFAVSSSTLRDAHWKAARQKGEKLRQEKLHEEHKQYHQHED